MYRDNDQYRSHGLEDWNLLDPPPVNASLLGFYNSDFKDYYTELAIDFMIRYSKWLRLQKPELKRTGQSNTLGLNTMMFVDQRLVAAAADRTGQKIGVFETIPEGKLYCMNDRVYHLWTVKKACEEVTVTRARYCQFIYEKIKEFELTQCLKAVHRLGLHEAMLV